jgi:hypothetical protein
VKDKLVNPPTALGGHFQILYDLKRSKKIKTQTEKSKSQGTTFDTRIGPLEFTHDFANGYPTDETVLRLYDERDFQRACQAYLWSLPAV